MTRPLRFSLVVCLLILCGLAVVLVPASRALAQDYGDDLATEAGAISGGDNASYPKEQTFDDSAATSWASSQGGGAVSGVSYIGQDFGEGISYQIRRFTIRQNAAANSEIDSVAVQYSPDASTWTTCEIVTLTKDGNLHSHDLPSCTSSRYWRLLANANPASGAWFVTEIEMFVLVATPTPTPTSTATITPTPTLTPTPRYSLESTLPSGDYFTVERSANFADITVIGMLALIAALLVILLGFQVSRRRQ